MASVSSLYHYHLLSLHLSCMQIKFNLHIKCEFIYFITSYFILGLFSIPGGPKSPGWYACHLHHTHKPSNEAAPCATPIDNHHNIPNIDDNDDDCTYPATATKIALHLHPNLSHTSHIDISVNRCHPQHLYTTRVCNVSRYWRSATISAREELSKAGLATMTVMMAGHVGMVVV